MRGKRERETSFEEENASVTQVYSLFIFEIYLIVEDLVNGSNDYEQFCMLENTKKTNIALAHEFFIDVRTLLRYKKKYNDIKNLINCNASIFVELIDKHFIDKTNNNE